MFVDRKPTRPNRYKITRENGDTYYVTLERADEPTEEGTPLNATTLNEMVTATANKVPMPTRSSVGHYIRVANVDGNGKIVAVDSVDLNTIVAASIEGA